MHSKMRLCIVVVATGLIATFLIGAAIFDLIHNPGSWTTVRDVWGAVAMFVGMLISFYLPLKADDP